MCEKMNEAKEQLLATLSQLCSEFKLCLFQFSMAWTWKPERETKP